MQFKKDSVVSGAGYQKFGEVDYFGKFNGVLVNATKVLSSYLELNFSENYNGGSRSGFSIYNSEFLWNIGKQQNDLAHGPVINRIKSMPFVTISFPENGQKSFNILFEDKNFYIYHNVGNYEKGVYYSNKKIELLCENNDDSSDQKSLVVTNNIDLDVDFRIGHMSLSDYEIENELYTYQDSDYKICRQKLSSKFSFAYGYSRWSDGDFYMGEYYYADYYKPERRGLGCYRWPNGDEYIGKFYQDKVQGFGVFTRNGQYEIGVFNNKRKNGTFIEIKKNNPNIIYIRKYNDERQYGDSFEYNVKTSTLTHKSSYGTSKVYSI